MMVNSSVSHRWKVSIGEGDGLVPTRQQGMSHEPMKAKIFDSMTCGAIMNVINHFTPLSSQFSLF